MSETVDLGYKLTEVGLIPNEWEVKTLESTISRARLGGNYFNQNIESSKPLMKMGNLARGHFDLAKIEYIPEKVRVDPEHRLRFGDLLFNTRNTLDLVGKVAIWREELPKAYYNSNLMRLEFNADVICSSIFANYVFNSESTVERLRAIATGTTSVAAIYTRDLMQVLLPVPPPAEQRAIAAALSDVDALLAKLDQFIAKKRDLTQAAMQQLLTGQTRLAGFHGEWEVKTLANVGTWRGGMTPSMQNPAYWDGGDFPWISSGDVKVSRLADTSQHVTSLAVRNGAAVVVPAGSIVLVTRSGILRKYLPVALVQKPMAINQDIKALIPNEALSAEFFLHAISGYGGEILAACLKAGTTVESLEFPWLKAFSISLPPRIEQAAIAAVLSDMDAEIAALEARRDKTRLLKQGMMQELLTGRTRLV